MSVRELNANISRAVAMIEAGESIDILKNGKVVGEMRPKQVERGDDPQWRAAMTELLALIDSGGLSFGRRFTHDERNG